MKNVLARGGIEFIEVFLGIALSLWVDEYRENNEIQRLNDSILNRLYDNLESDSTNFTWVINAHKTSLKSCNSINKWIDSSQNILVKPFGYTNRNREYFLMKLEEGIRKLKTKN